MGSRFTTPSRIANKNAAPSNDRRLSANVFGPPSPRRTIAVSTGEAYPKQRRIVKKQSRMLGNTPVHRVCYTLNATNACCNSQAKGVRV